MSSDSSEPSDLRPMRRLPWRSAFVFGILTIGLLASALPSPALSEDVDMFGDRAIGNTDHQARTNPLADLARLFDHDRADEPRSHVAFHDALLLVDPYPALHVEVDFAEGRAPSPMALEALRETMLLATDKENVTIGTPRAFTPTSTDHHTLDQLKTVARGTRDVDPQLETPAAETYILHVVYMDGTGWTTRDGDDQALLGLHVGSIGTIYMFPERIDTLGRPRGHGPVDATLFAPYLERAVLIHELGHAFGLVGDEIPQTTPHEDPDRPHHSKNPESVMYWSHADWYRKYGPQWDGDVVPYAFDDDDLADLEAYRERRR